MADITKLDAFIQSSPQPSWLATAQGHCVYANPALERLTGFNSDQIHQSDWRSFLLEGDRAAASASWQRSLATGAPYRVQVRMRGSDGAPEWVELIAFGHKAGDGTELWLFTGSDVNGVAAQKRPELEAQIQATLNVIPAHTWYALPSGALTFVNERTANYLGLPKDHPLRFGIDTGAEWDSHTALLHPDDREEARRVWSTCLSTGTAGEFTFRVPSAEGKYRWFLTLAEPLRANDGTLLYWIGVNLDIDDGKRADDALRKSEKELRDVIDTIPAIVWSTLADGSNTYVNKRFVEYSGSSAEQTAGSGWQALIHPDDLERHAGKWREAVATGKAHEIEVRSRRSDGQYRWQLDRGVPLRDEDGKIVKWYGIATDIEDRKRAEEALQQSQFYLSEGQRLAHMGSWAFNATGFTYWSSELFQIYGLDPGDKPPTVEEYLALVHPEDRAFMKEGIAKMLDDRLAFDFTKRIVRPDGGIRHIRCVGIPVTQGEIFQGFLGTGMDVTDQERLTEELRRSESHLAEAQKLTHTGSWAWRLADRKMVHISEEWYRIYGFDLAEGAPTLEEYLERVHPEDRLKWEGMAERAIVEKADYDQEFRILLPNGMVKWIQTVGHPVLSNTGDLDGFVGSSTDITELKSAEQEREKVRQLEADLAHTNRVSTLGEMAASLAHEIKQPIAAAITSANSCIEWLSHEPPNLDRARAAAARIDKYGNRAAEIIDRIRSFYRKSPPQRELVDVNGIVHELLTLLNGEATRFSVAMRTDLSAELPKIMVDRVQLQQVFMNLMLNAIEAMKESGGELTVKSELQDGQLQFSVSDTGVGLHMEKMDQIFSAFFTTKPQGSGMGLAISRSIVESHGGQLWASTNSGSGATFHFTLPIQVTESSPLVA
jgi:PAS domain S-box-containing protein